MNTPLSAIPPRIAPRIALIAFDLDGTLADTESLSLPSAVETMREFGVPVTLDYWYKHLHGLSGASLIAAVNEQFGIAVDTAAFVQRRREMVPQMFAGGVPPAPGMLQALRALVAAGLQLCICSNSTDERIALTLEKITGQHAAGLQLPQVFEGHIFSAPGNNGLGKTKPHPDVYLRAASSYQATPAACVAVEDTPIGVTAAVQAGFTCIGYTGLIPHKPQAEAAEELKHAGAHHTMAHWDELLPLLQTLKI